MNPILKQRAISIAKPHLRKLLGAGPGEPVYPRLQWVRSRIKAASGLKSLHEGSRIEFSGPMHGWCVPFDVPGPGAREVLVKTTFSAISPGTEVATFMVRPNTGASFPDYPGYSGVGEVVARGRRVRGLAVGQLVAAPLGHASLATLPASSVFALPAGVDPVEASFIRIGIIAYQGVHRAQIRAGEKVAVLGRGVIGQLAGQLARAHGASELVSIARTPGHVSKALPRFASRMVDTGNGGDAELPSVAADVTFEVTGNPAALHDAIRATRDGGRIVLLGSSRGVTKGVDWGLLADRTITLVGSNIRTLPVPGEGLPYGYRALGESFLKLLAERRLDVAGLVDQVVNPWEAGWFFSQLAEGLTESVGAVFQWDHLSPEDRQRPTTLLAPPHTKPIDARKLTQELTGGGLFDLESPRMETNTGTAPPASPAARKGTGTLRIAIIGCGERGSENADAVRHATRTELAAVMDVNAALAQKEGQRLGVPWGTDYEAILEDPSVDVVFLSTPHHLHLGQTVAAAKAGKHIIVEKPLATNLADAVAMARAASRAGVQLTAWLGFRYFPHMVKAKRIMDAGAVGRILGGHLTFHSYKPKSYWTGGFSGKGSDWRARWDTSGGGVLIMTGIHYLDWLLHLTGLRVKEVSARYATLNSPAEVEDTIALWLTFENGAMASVDMSSCVQGGASAIVELRIWGTEGQISLTPPYQFYSTRLVEGNKPERWSSFDPLPKARHGDVRMGISMDYLDRFAEAIAEGRALDVPAEDAVELQAVIEAAYRSSREGRPVAVEYPELT